MWFEERGTYDIKMINNKCQLITSFICNLWVYLLGPVTNNYTWSCNMFFVSAAHLAAQKYQIFERKIKCIVSQNKKCKINLENVEYQNGPTRHLPSRACKTTPVWSSVETQAQIERHRQSKANININSKTTK